MWNREQRQDDTVVDRFSQDLSACISRRRCVGVPSRGGQDTYIAPVVVRVVFLAAEFDHDYVQL